MKITSTLLKYFYFSIVHSLTDKAIDWDAQKSNVSENEIEVIQWCKTNGWKYINDSNIQGTEDECVVILTRPIYRMFPEYISRARNLLVIVTTCQNFADFAKE